MHFRGSYVALVTPMKADRSVDFDALLRLVDWHISSGTDGLVILGTTGESATITPDERRSIIKKTVSHVNGRLPIIVGTGSSCTSTALRLTREAHELGSDAAMLITPCYVKPSQQGLFEHFSTLAKGCSISQILYNVPSRSGCDLLPKTIAKLADSSNIVAVKEATGDLHRLRELLDLETGLSLLSGDDPSSVDFMLSGGHGVISVTCNVVPSLLNRISQLALSGDTSAALAMDKPLKDLHRVLFVESNPIPVKWLLQRMRYIHGALRLPLTELDSQYHADVSCVSASLGLVDNVKRGSYV
tara:strand:- start:187 stop:1089 length:903 start_codon:yes stop_codon:yes gene_type:complete